MGALAKASLAAVALSLAALSPAAAERLTGSEVVALMSQGAITFAAGSRWSTLPGNRYRMTHPTGSEEGSFRIFSDGTVERHDETRDRTIRYHFDRAADGTVSAVYGDGSTYPLK